MLVLAPVPRESVSQKGSQFGTTEAAQARLMDLPIPLVPPSRLKVQKRLQVVDQHLVGGQRWTPACQEHHQRRQGLILGP